MADWERTDSCASRNHYPPAQFTRGLHYAIDPSGLPKVMVRERELTPTNEFGLPDALAVIDAVAKHLRADYAPPHMPKVFNRDHLLHDAVLYADNPYLHALREHPTMSIQWPIPTHNTKHALLEAPDVPKVDFAHDYMEEQTHIDGLYRFAWTALDSARQAQDLRAQTFVLPKSDRAESLEVAKIKQDSANRQHNGFYDFLNEWDAGRGLGRMPSVSLLGGVSLQQAVEILEPLVAPSKGRILVDYTLQSIAENGWKEDEMQEELEPAAA